MKKFHDSLFIVGTNKKERKSGKRKKCESAWRTKVVRDQVVRDKRIDQIANVCLHEISPPFSRFHHQSAYQSKADILANPNTLGSV